MRWYQYQIPLGYFREGVAGIRSGNWDVVQLQTTALTGNPEFSSHRDYLEAAFEIYRGELDKAEGLLETAGNDPAVQPYALVAEGVIALQRGDLERAKTKAQAALELDAELPEAKEVKRGLENIEQPMTRVTRALQGLDAGDLKTVESEIKALMETPIGDDEDSHLGDFIEDVTIASPVDAATDEGLTEATREVLGGLTAREAKVLRMRFGIDMNTDHTLEEVGKQFDVTRERIRQIEAKALRKLRHPSRSDHLRSFLDE